MRFSAELRASTALSGLSEEAFALISVFIGYGLLLTLSGVEVQRYYLIITFPLEWLMLAVLARKYVPRPRSLLLLLWCGQLMLSLTYLHYIHENHGAIRGDYGEGFRWRTQKSPTP
jgi:hypothetical protein